MSMLRVSARQLLPCDDRLSLPQQIYNRPAARQRRMRSVCGAAGNDSVSASGGMREDAGDGSDTN